MYRGSQGAQNANVETDLNQSHEFFCPNIGQQCPYSSQEIDPTMTRQKNQRRPYYPYYHHHIHHHHHYYHNFPTPYNYPMYGGEYEEYD